VVAGLIADEKVVGMFDGRMEFGPRALGNRSILGDARSARMQSVMNLKIKYRESFRPFAPSVAEEKAADYFELDRPSPYMLLVADVVPERRKPRTGDERELPLVEWVNRPRSDIPAVTHVDDSARIQTVSAETNPRYHRILTELETLTGYAVVVNTSFNVRGEPIVCTPEDAYRCFQRTEMDYLVLGDFLLDKTEQPGSRRRATGARSSSSTDRMERRPTPHAQAQLPRPSAQRALPVRPHPQGLLDRAAVADPRAGGAAGGDQPVGGSFYLYFVLGVVGGSMLWRPLKVAWRSPGSSTLRPRLGFREGPEAAYICIAKRTTSPAVPRWLDLENDEFYNHQEQANASRNNRYVVA
jgi:hypothetical protein